MSTKLQYYSQLAENSANQVTQSREQWTSFLKTAARLYKYPYHEQLMIYAQRPDAQACADFELWNDTMNRWIKRGSKGIALIVDSGHTPRLRYVFDVSDTKDGRKNARSVNLWELREEHEILVKDALCRRYGDRTGDLGDILCNLADELADDYWTNNKHDILYSIEDSYLSDFDEMNVEIAYTNTLKNSLAYSLLSRCGIEPDNYLEDEDFTPVLNFNTPDALAALGTGVSDLSEQVLREIGVTVKRYDYQKEQENERNVQHGQIDIPAARGLSGAEPDVTEPVTGQTPGQIRVDAPEPFKDKPANLIQFPDIEGTVIPPSVRDTGNSPEKFDTNREGVNEEQPATGQNHQSNGMVTAHEQPAPSSGRNDINRTDLQLNTETNETPPILEHPKPGGISMPVEDKTISNSSHSALTAALVDSPFTLEQVDAILRNGGNQSQSVLHIAAYYMKDKPLTDNAAFLAREYSRGGKGFQFGEQQVSVWFDETGMILGNGKTARLDKQQIHLTWEQVAFCIRELLDEGQYLPRDMLDKAIDNERTELASRLIFFYRDDLRDFREYPPQFRSEESGGYPVEERRVKELLDDAEERELIIERFEEDVTALLTDPNAPTRHWHDPHQLLQDVRDSQIIPHTFPTQNTIQAPDYKRFITEDEVDAFFQSDGRYEDGKYSILSYFLQEHTSRELADMIKGRYQNSGGSNALCRADDSWYDGFGTKLKLTRSDLSQPYSEVALTWNAAAKHILKLIQEGRYMTQAELDYTGEYEKRTLAQEISNFYHRLPLDMPHHYNTQDNLFDYSDRNIVRTLLDDPVQVDTLLTAMRPIVEGTHADDKFLESRNTALRHLMEYKAGTFTLFPGLDKLPTPEQTAVGNNVLSGVNVPKEMDYVEDAVQEEEESHQSLPLQITQEDIDTILLGAVGTPEQVERIVAQFEKNPRTREAVQSIKEVYSDRVFRMERIDEKRYMELNGHSNGITVSKSDPPSQSDNQHNPSISIDISWAKVHRRVMELAKEGQFLTSEAPAQTQDAPEQTTPANPNTPEPGKQGDSFTAALEDYRAFEQQYSGAIVAMQNRGNYMIYGDSVKEVMHLLERKVMRRSLPGGGAVAYTGLPVNREDEYLETIQASGLPFVIVAVNPENNSLFVKHKFNIEAPEQTAPSLQDMQTQQDQTDDYQTVNLQTVDDDMLDVLKNGLLDIKRYNSVALMLSNGASNTEIAHYLYNSYGNETDTMELETGDTADYFISSVGVQVDILDKFDTKKAMAWQEIVATVRALAAEPQQEQATPDIEDYEDISDTTKNEYLTEYVLDYGYVNDRLIVYNIKDHDSDDLPEIVVRIEPDGSIVYLNDHLPLETRLEIENVAENDYERYRAESEAQIHQMLDYAESVVAADPEQNRSASPRPESETPADVKPSFAPTQEIADFVKSKIEAGEKFTSTELFAQASKAYGDTMANNAYTSKDAYDAMELGVNQYILACDAVSPESMLAMLELLPTQTRRTPDMEKFEQFSTPPSIAYLANWAANIGTNDIMLEPSAGNGGIAVFAKKDGAKVYVNELNKRRLEIIKNLPFDGFFNEDAEQINNIHGAKIAPTVIVMNPPFTSSAERNIHNNKIGSKHISEALKMLAPNGRLVAIVGQGMADDAPAFRSWWQEIKGQYNVKANIGIDGKNYSKYGTTFGIQLLVIDKDGATTQPVKTAFVENLLELQNILEEIRNDRPSIAFEQDNRNEQNPITTARSGIATQREPEHGSNDTVLDPGGETDTAAIGNRQEKTGTSAPVTAVRGTSDTSSQLTDINDDGHPLIINEERQTGNDIGNDGDSGIGRTGNADSGQPAGRIEPLKRQSKPVKKELTDSIFEQYEPQPLLLENVQPHPANISESAAMSAIVPPPVTYKPSLSQNIIKNGILSDVQLEAVTYAGQSHSQTLPRGYTRGFFLGDGTGVGKGRTITGIILDNYMQGRKKAVWLSENRGLVPDAKRDVKALFGTSDSVVEFQGGKKADASLSVDEGILFVTYSTLSKGYDQGGSNFEKIMNWLGKDFDGVIVFDEAHNMANSIAKKGNRGIKRASQRGMAGLAIQEALPKAKIIYSSATGATEVENLRYAERLGLWGEGTAFPNGDDFVFKIKAGGLAAMELIARDMKAMGVYLSRNISYEDVVYDKILHELSPEQRRIYDELARSWQIVLQNLNKALETTNQNQDGMAKGKAYGAFWSAEQRFFNQILTAMQVPSMISDMEKQLEEGNSIVIQLVSTNEAAQEREFARLQEQDLELDDFDLTPKQMLMSYIENSSPIVQFEKYEDDNGNVRSRPVYDSQGNAVINREAVRQKEMLLDKLGSVKVPASALDMIINHFGSDNVAENTGRKRRVVVKDGKPKEENIASKKEADVTAFQDGDKRIIVFSKAGGTGKSYHADKSAKNQQHRVHYLLQAGWQADAAVQGFGRSHRSNQVSSPTFALVTTDLKGQMRFISTIAKRLDQLGALTKGQRQTGSQGLFTAGDNLENAFAADVLASYYKSLILNKVHGVSDGISIIEKLGLKEKLIDEYGQMNPNVPELREVNKFLNRILSLECSEQNAVFDGYAERLEAATERALQEGILDKGLENYRADKIDLKEAHDIRTDETTGATTKYYNLTAYDKVKPLRFAQVNTQHHSFVGFYQNEHTDAVRAVFKTSSTTDQYGHISDNYRLTGQDGNAYIPQSKFINNWKPLTAEIAEGLWNDAVKELPEFHTSNLHLIGGAVLPVWDKLPTENVRIYRVLTSDGEMLIGRMIPESMIDATLHKLGATREKELIQTEDLLKCVKNGDTVYLENGWKIMQRKVSNERRIEVIGPEYLHFDLLAKKGVFTERISYQTRYFIPAEKDTIQILDEISKISPVSRVERGNERATAKSHPSIAEIKKPEHESGKSERPSILAQLKKMMASVHPQSKGKATDLSI